MQDYINGMLYLYRQKFISFAILIYDWNKMYQIN